MRYLLIAPLLICLLACNNDSGTSSEEPECKYGKPVAIFSEDIPEIAKQSFVSKGQKGIETVEFTNGTSLELYQSGCNEVRQEYRFFIKGNYKDKEDDFWFDQAIEQLSFVGQLDDRYAVIGIWVGAIKQRLEDMRIGEFIEVEPNTFIRVDKITEEESAMVIIMLERRI